MLESGSPPHDAAGMSSGILHHRLGFTCESTIAGVTATTVYVAVVGGITGKFLSRHPASGRGSLGANLYVLIGCAVVSSTPTCVVIR